MEQLETRHNRTGGLRQVANFYGILGFVRLPDWHIVLVENRRQVGTLMGKPVFTVAKTLMFPVCSPEHNLTDQTFLDQRANYKYMFSYNSFEEDCYFSSSLDLTRPLQYNRAGAMLHQIRRTIKGEREAQGGAGPFVLREVPLDLIPGLPPAPGPAPAPGAPSSSGDANHAYYVSSATEGAGDEDASRVLPLTQRVAFGSLLKRQATSRLWQARPAETEAKSPKGGASVTASSDSLPQANAVRRPPSAFLYYEDKFVWNFFMLQPFLAEPLLFPPAGWPVPAVPTTTTTPPSSSTTTTKDDEAKNVPPDATENSFPPDEQKTQPEESDEKIGCRAPSLQWTVACMLGFFEQQRVS